MSGFEMAYTALGGLGIFFLGMKFLSESLQALAGDLIRKIINLLTTNRILAVLVGTLVTTIVQSSSVTTVMVVGMVNAGLMNLAQAIGVIFGANIGTTITGWIIAIKVGKYGLLFLALGSFPMFFIKNDRWKSTGKLLVALGFVFIGLKTMSGAFKPLRNDHTFTSYLHLFTADSYFSLLGCILIGCLLTMIIQSSSAMLGITIALASTGTISFQTAMGLVLGENIGTTITALLASIGTNITAKRAARAHAVFNVLGVFAMSFLFWKYVHLVDWVIAGDPNFMATDGSKPNIAAHIAAGHSLFNVTATILFLPLLGYLAKFVTWITPGDEKKEKSSFLPIPNAAVAPALGLEQAELSVNQMMDELKSLIKNTQKYIALEEDNPKLMDKIVKAENLFDTQQKDITLFLVNLLESPLTTEQSALAYALIRQADEIESVSDYCVKLAKLYLKTMKDKKGVSANAKREMQELLEEVERFYDKALNYSKSKDSGDIENFEVTKNQINHQAKRVRENHLKRIKDGKCSALAGLAYSDMIVAARRIKDHSVNIIEAVQSGLPI